MIRGGGDNPLGEGSNDFLLLDIFSKDLFT